MSLVTPSLPKMASPIASSSGFLTMPPQHKPSTHLIAGEWDPHGLPSAPLPATAASYTIPSINATIAAVSSFVGLAEAICLSILC